MLHSQVVSTDIYYDENCTFHWKKSFQNSSQFTMYLTTCRIYGWTTKYITGECGSLKVIYRKIHTSFQVIM